MLWLLLTSALSISPGPIPSSALTDVTTLTIGGGQMAGAALDASALKVGAPATVTELDLGKLKGELRQVGWSADGAELYVQTADGHPDAEKLRHYIVSTAGGAPKAIDAMPDWAKGYWDAKADRFAPGLRSIVIELEQKIERVKIGIGTGRPGEMGGATGGVSADKIAEGQGQNVARLVVFGETISEFVNQRAIPGLMFSWGPLASGAIAYTDREDGRLMLLDQHKHKQTIAGVKDALLPAWSIDGSRLAWVQKSGRKKYTLRWATVSKD
jgi:hypothetical protein